jgi:aminoglycoside phosphotransferase (APT) family kinase protein
MNQVLVAIHSVNIDKQGLSDYGKPGNYFQRQLKRWTQQYRATETNHIEAMETLLAWLPKNLPADDGRVSLVHGDFRLDNMLLDPDSHKILAVVDWELSTLGHPYSDLAYQCMQWRLPPLGDLSGLLGKDRKALGIPTEEEYIALYCQRMGIDKIEHWSFYLAFSFFRLAAILQGVKKRALDGNASNKKAQSMGELVKPLAEMAIELIH